MQKNLSPEDIEICYRISLLFAFRRILTKPVPFPRNFNKLALDFISRLLEKSARRRLGRNGVDEIKNHLFLADVDWYKCERRELKPPIVPKILNDVSFSFWISWYVVLWSSN